ncbi:hypothetical protein ACO0LC_27870 [Undibacterium sp. JH2W]|uniref:hypothetical protein n=1 Tax=Undibacterium sp. JH2W TaxID=3413037 RepID=UPI003BF4170E
MTAFFLLPYALAFIVALVLPLRPAPVAVAALIAALIVSLPLASLYNNGAGGDDMPYDAALGLFILALACTGLCAGIGTRLLLWRRAHFRRSQLPRAAVTLTGFLLLPTVFFAII